MNRDPDAQLEDTQRRGWELLGLTEQEVVERGQQQGLIVRIARHGDEFGRRDRNTGRLTLTLQDDRVVDVRAG